MMIEEEIGYDLKQPQWINGYKKGVAIRNKNQNEKPLILTGIPFLSAKTFCTID